MKILLSAVLLGSLVSGCANENGSDSAPAEEASVEEATPAESSSESTSRDPKWMIAIDGLPERHGSNITAVTMGDEGYGNYAFARSGFTGSITYHKDDVAPMMSFKFSEENIRCVNKKGASLTRESERVVIAGEVICFTEGSDLDDAPPSTIDGYFTIKQ